MTVLPESNVAEGLALLKGMEFAKEMLFLTLKVEADSSNVITAINEAQHQSNLVPFVNDKFNLIHFKIKTHLTLFIIIRSY